MHKDPTAFQGAMRLSCAGVSWAPAGPALGGTGSRLSLPTSNPAFPPHLEPSSAAPAGLTLSGLRLFTSLGHFQFPMTLPSPGGLPFLPPSHTPQTREHTHFTRSSASSCPKHFPLSLGSRTRSFIEPNPWGCSVMSPGSTREEAVSLSPGVLAVLWVGEGRDKASFCPRCLWLSCKASTTAENARAGPKRQAACLGEGRCPWLSPCPGLPEGRLCQELGTVFRLRALCSFASPV